MQRKQSMILVSARPSGRLLCRFAEPRQRSERRKSRSDRFSLAHGLKQLAKIFRQIAHIFTSRVIQALPRNAWNQVIEFGDQRQALFRRDLTLEECTRQVSPGVKKR